MVFSVFFRIIIVHLRIKEKYLSTENLITLIAAALAFLASIIATGVSIYNTRFAKFTQQSWWDRKVVAYSQITEALSSLVYYYEVVYDAEVEHREISDQRQTEIAEHWKKGYAEIKKATATGAFLISAEAEAALQKMWKEKGRGIHPFDWFERIESDYIAARDCLKGIVDAAKKDLKVR